MFGLHSAALRHPDLYLFSREGRYVQYAVLSPLVLGSDAPASYLSFIAASVLQPWMTRCLLYARFMPHAPRTSSLPKCQSQVVPGPLLPALLLYTQLLGPAQLCSRLSSLVLLLPRTMFFCYVVVRPVVNGMRGDRHHTLRSASSWLLSLATPLATVLPRRNLSNSHFSKAGPPHRNV